MGHRSSTRRLLYVLALLALFAAGCEAGDERGVATPGETAAAPLPPAPRATPRPGIRFDPATLRPGDRVGELVADSVEARWAAIDSSYVGVARFAGRIILSGRTMLHPDADLRAVTRCFEADPASAARLPRWLHDERRPWFCFENAPDAERSLGAPSEGVALTLVVEDFTIHRGLTDEVNSARFVRVAGAEAESSGA